MAKSSIKTAGIKVAKVVTPDWETIGTGIAKAIQGRSVAAEQLENDYQSRKAALDAPVMTLLGKLASLAPKCSLSDFVEHIQPVMLKVLGQEKLSPNLIKYRLAFLGLAHGIAVPEGVKSAQQYANDTAREALIELDVITAGKGRPAGKASESNDAAKETKTANALSVDARIAAFANIFPGTKAQKAARVNYISAIVESDPDAKLFDKMLRDLAAKFN